MAIENWIPLDPCPRGWTAARFAGISRGKSSKSGNGRTSTRGTPRVTRLADKLSDRNLAQHHAISRPRSADEDNALWLTWKRTPSGSSEFKICVRFVMHLAVFVCVKMLLALSVRFGSFWYGIKQASWISQSFCVVCFLEAERNKTHQQIESKTTQGEKYDHRQSPRVCISQGGLSSSAPYRSSGDAEMLEDVGSHYIQDVMYLVHKDPMDWHTDAALEQSFLQVLSGGHMAYVSTTGHWSISALVTSDSRNIDPGIKGSGPCIPMFNYASYQDTISGSPLVFLHNLR